MTHTICLDIETTDLSPMSGMIISIGVKDDREEMVFMYNKQSGEKKVLQDFWSYIFEKRKFDMIKLAGFGNADFDIPYINIRSIKHDIKILQPQNQYGVIDLRKLLTNYNPLMKGKLTDFCRLFNIKDEDGDLMGFQMSEAFIKEEFDRIRQHNLYDIRRTYKLFKKVEGVGLI